VQSVQSVQSCNPCNPCNPWLKKQNLHSQTTSCVLLTFEKTLNLKSTSILKYFAICVAILFLTCQAEKAEDARLPNIVFILADDLGYGELGSYGQKLIETPNIDKLATEGMSFMQHYAGAPVCAPSRCILLTGKHAGHAYIRGNDEWKSRGDVWNYQAMYDDPGLEGQRPLLSEEVTIAEILQQTGYTTACVGKWGLGAPGSEGTPNKKGFDYFYGYNCQRQAHTLYPGHLYENEERVFLNNKLLAPHTPIPADADTMDPGTYAEFDLNEYAPELMGQKAIDFIKSEKDNPFFLLFASPLPHVPLQAPEKWISYYGDKFEETTPYHGKHYFPSYRPRATYASMISYLDEQVGMIVSALEEAGVLDNTLIIFTSDNGPTYTGGADTEFFESAAPFRTDYGRGKGFLYEGGIRVPMIASWPGVITEGSTSQHISASYDFANTFAEIAGVNDRAEFEDGISMLPTLKGEAQKQRQHDFLYFEQPEYHGQQAVRYQNWKGIVTELKDGNTHIELYDLKTDETESDDVSDKYPAIASMIDSIMQREHVKPEIELFLLPIDTVGS